MVEIKPGSEPDRRGMGSKSRRRRTTRRLTLDKYRRLERIVESVVLVIGVVGLLSLVTLSNDYEQASPDAASYRVAGDVSPGQTESA